jgi:predicted metal-dependent hydrolase
VVEYGRTVIELQVPPGADVERRERLLLRWYRCRPRELNPPLLERRERTLGVSVAEWRIKRMKTGACNVDARRIWLNLELAKKPAQCLEYIVVRELSHVLERHHTERFTAIMDQHLPQWRSRRQELNSAPLAHESWAH